MKKLTAILFSLAMLTGNLTVAAEDAPTPAKLDDAVIEQLINDWHDKDEDGIISTDEFNSIQYLTLDLTDITDLSFLFDIPHLQALHLSNGNFTNLDMLTKLPNINSLSLHNMELDDISFLMNMSLDHCMLENVESKEPFDTFQLLRLHNYTFEQGYEETISIYPYGLYDDELFEITIDDHSIVFEDDEFGTKASYQDIYTLAEGETTFHVFLDGKEIYEGKITVTPKNITHEPITADVISWADSWCPEHKKNIVDTLIGDKLYRINNTEITLLKEGISKRLNPYLFGFDEKSTWHQCLIELYTDGTLFADGEQVLPDEHFINIRKNLALTDNHKLYALYRENNVNIWALVTDDCAELLSTEEIPLYRATDGRIFTYTPSSNHSVSVCKTSISEIKEVFYSYILDDNGNIWEYYKGNLHHVASDASDIGIFATKEDGNRSCYLSTDGKAFLLDGSGQVTVTETPDCDLKNAADGVFFFEDWYESGEKSEADCGGRWWLTDDGILSISYCDQRFAIDNSANVINEGYDKKENKHYVFFLRKDASIWRYCIETEKAEQVLEGEAAPTTGDLNNDGTVSVADAVMLQKWLTGQKTDNFYLQAADQNQDNLITAADLTLLKRSLIKK